VLGVKVERRQYMDTISNSCVPDRVYYQFMDKSYGGKRKKLILERNYIATQALAKIKSKRNHKNSYKFCFR
jgi:hypothetical protein